MEHQPAVAVSLIYLCGRVKREGFAFWCCVTHGQGDDHESHRVSGRLDVYGWMLQTLPAKGFVDNISSRVLLRNMLLNVACH